MFYIALIKRRSAKNGRCRIVHAGKHFSLHWWNHFAFRVMRILIWSFCTTRLFLPGADQFAVLLPLAEQAGLRLVGALILTLGFGIAVYGNLKLQQAWRSGIDAAAPESLKIDGVYQLSRNPIYLGVLTGQFGFFLAIPSVFTLACLFIGVTSIRLQIHLEEIHLQRRFPETYPKYRLAVPRWL